MTDYADDLTLSMGRMKLCKSCAACNAIVFVNYTRDLPPDYEQILGYYLDLKLSEECGCDRKV